MPESFRCLHCLLLLRLRLHMSLLLQNQISHMQVRLLLQRNQPVMHSYHLIQRMLLHLQLLLRILLQAPEFQHCKDFQRYHLPLPLLYYL